MQPAEVRKPPVGAVFALHLPREPGKCPWCGLPIEERTPVRKQLKTIHAACNAELAIISDPSQARWYVLKRDKGICADCGEDWSEMARFFPTFIVPPREHHYYERSLRVTEGPKVGQIVRLSEEVFDWDAPRKKREVFLYVALTAVSLWHVDHKTPLWKVRHMSPLERLEYFKLANLITRCEPCHKVKTREEAAERAKFERLADPRRESKPKERFRRPRFEPTPVKRLEDL